MGEIGIADQTMGLANFRPKDLYPMQIIFIDSVMILRPCLSAVTKLHRTKPLSVLHHYWIRVAFLGPAICEIKNDIKFQYLNLHLGNQMVKRFFSWFDNFVEGFSTDVNCFNGFDKKRLSSVWNRVTVSSKFEARPRGLRC
jgi:hypothetical protein